MAEQTTTNIWGKLFAIQKAIKTFAVSEESEKRDTKGRATYQYTPGWEIVETIREHMDKAGLMLIPEYKTRDVQPIEYPLYKLVKDKPVTFVKKEIHFVVDAAFTWVDTTTGEKEGPFSIVASGANGTDKSCASALALAERYFLLKFFHITTHEKDDEPDAHDSGTVPGIPSESQPMDAPYQAAPAPVQAPAYCPVVQQPMAGFPQAQPPVYGPVYQPVPGFAPQGGGMMPPAAPAGGAFDPNHPAIVDAVNRLANFQKGTPTHQQQLNEIICNLTAAGFKSFEQSFLENLTECGQAKREGRNPVLK